MAFKMTDNEIKKALEYWEQFDKEIDVLIKRYPEEKADLLEQREILKITFGVFDLINRQKAEIERLQNKVFAKEQEYNDMLEQRNSVEKHLETAKAEAYKECIEKVKERLSTCVTDTQQMVFELRLDNLLKELVGDNDG